MMIVSSEVTQPEIGAGFSANPGSLALESTCFLGSQENLGLRFKALGFEVLRRFRDPGS
jgi:hypothetical protein